MPHSNLTKTSSSSDSESSTSTATPRRTQRRIDFGPSTDSGAQIELRDVSLRFVSYFNKQYSLKRAAIDLLLRREGGPPLAEFWAIKNVDLEIRKGERIGIVGHNGAGKSTLLRMLARIYPPTSGQITVRGTVAPLIEMGAGFNPELSGYDNILLNGAMLGYSRKQMEARVEGIWEFTELKPFADRPLKYYSSGMYMRLAFAIATEIHPDILLIDESLGAGDAAFIEKAKARVTGLLDRSNVVIIVSHDLASLRKMCDRGIWMKAGRVVGDGPIDEIIDLYLADGRPPEPPPSDDVLVDEATTDLEEPSLPTPE